MDLSRKSTVDVSTQTDSQKRPYYPRKLKKAIFKEVKGGMPARKVAEKFNLPNVQVVYNILKWCRNEGFHGLTSHRLVDYLNSGSCKIHTADDNFEIIVPDNGNDQPIPRATDNLRALNFRDSLRGLTLQPEQAVHLKHVLQSFMK